MFYPLLRRNLILLELTQILQKIRRFLSFLLTFISYNSNHIFFTENLCFLLLSSPLGKAIIFILEVIEKMIVFRELPMNMITFLLLFDIFE
jgi:hypothetical protein